ncbi:MAG TPA: hypothetical protein VKM94_15775 [Blastocatellia bacterium]|nr:hypothetical protein [Blastocatellia bacterium]
MKKMKTLLAIAVMAFCLNAAPVALKSHSSAFAETPVTVQTTSGAYGAILSEGRSRGTQIAIGVTLGVAAAVIGIATGGAGAVVAGALAGV